MATPFMFLTCTIPNTKSPNNKTDVYLQPVIDELKGLWDVEIETYNIPIGKIFQINTVLMWIINDFSAYGMLSRWSTNGQLAHPICRK